MYELFRIIVSCKKNVTFTSRDIFYSQTDGVAIGFPLRPALASIFWVELERSLVFLLAAELSLCERFAIGTITFIKIGTVDHILSMLNNLHTNIQFPYETKYNLKLVFLDLCYEGIGKILSQQSIEKSLTVMFILIGIRLPLIVINKNP